MVATLTPPTLQKLVLALLSEVSPTMYTHILYEQHVQFRGQGGAFAPLPLPFDFG